MKINMIMIVLVSVLVVILIYSFKRQNPAVDEVTVETVAEKIKTDSSLVLLDVRTPEEFDGELGHLAGAILIPVNELGSRMAELEQYKDREIIVYCRSGNRSRTATRMMRGEGFNALNMLGGMRAWNKMMAADTTEVK